MIKPKQGPERAARVLAPVAGLILALCCRWALALPEDANQPIETQSLSSELQLDKGLVIYYGSAENPARIKRGTMQITGLEIRIVRQEGQLQSVVATGKPAHFEQQLEADQEPVRASGANIAFDNAKQQVTIDGDAEFIQAGNTVNSPHIDYDLTTHRANATSDGDGESVRMTIPSDQL